MILVEELKRDNQEFYKLMGCYFGSRQVAKEVGINIYDDENKKWYVVVDGHEVVGFASLKNKLVSDCYVIPSYRNNGIFTAILCYIKQKTTGKLLANCTVKSKQVFKNAGFIEKRSSKNFTFMELNRA